MRILQICNKLTYPPNEGGSVAVLSISLPLASAGHEITIFSFVSNKHDLSAKSRSELEKHVKLMLYRNEVSVSMLKIIRNFLFSGLPYTAEGFINKSFRDQLGQLLKNEQFDIIQIEGLYLLPYIDTIKKYSDALVSFRSHNAEHEIWQTLAKHVKNPVKKMYFLSLANRLKRMAAFYCDKFDLLVPISARDLDYYRSAGCSKPAIVCSTGYNLENKGRPSVSQERNSLFYIGSLDWLPNQQGLIWFVEKVYRDLIKTHPSLKFHIAGRNASWGFLKRIEHPDVIYHGEVDDSADFISNWGICIVPLFAGSGIRIKIIESMALGRPVVATSKAAEGLEVTDKENILIADTPSDFVRCISAILNDDALYDSLSAEGRKLVESFYNRDKIAGSLIEFYNLCLP